MEYINKNNNNRYISQLHNYGTEEKPMYTDYCDIIDTHNNNEIVYTQHGMLTARLLEEINNPIAHNIESTEEYIARVKQMEGLS
jgi:hypothetical protein